MFIKVEPGDFFMYGVKLIFDLEHPDSEDQQVRDYLKEHELEPKYQGTGEFEGRRCELKHQSPGVLPRKEPAPIVMNLSWRLRKDHSLTTLGRHSRRGKLPRPEGAYASSEL